MTETIDYQAYLLTEAWKALSDETKRLAGNRCQVCYSDGELHAHHRTYLHIGHELQSDLIALCSHCHALFHGKSDAVSGGWALTQSLASELSMLRAREQARIAVEQCDERKAAAAMTGLGEMWSVCDE